MKRVIIGFVLGSVFCLTGCFAGISDSDSEVNSSFIPSESPSLSVPSSLVTNEASIVNNDISKDFELVIPSSVPVPTSHYQKENPTFNPVATIIEAD